jgi:hypothetical protein
MQKNDSLPDLSDIEKLLKEITSIAIVGLSPKEDRPSNMVARYLMDAGYTIYPVNPGQKEILGKTCYPDLLSIPNKVDVVNIFRKPEDVPPIVDDAVAIGAQAVWMQQGISSDSGADVARSNGLFVVMDRCIKIDHSALGL